MWEEHDSPTQLNRKAHPELRFHEPLWNELLLRMVDAGFNAVVLDLGDGVRYNSHPEIAVHGAWDPERLADEAEHLRSLGLELVPKLNFSSGHDTWLGPVYSRSLSTPLYYEVCRDLIAEVIALTRPRLFHLGMDEEIYIEQQEQNYIVIRQNDLFWNDLLFLCGEVEKGGARPWVWTDTMWENGPEVFLRRMPRSVLQSVWYYGTDFNSPRATAYGELSDAGFDQVPTCSCFSHENNPELLVAHCRRVISPQHLCGFLQTSWYPTLSEYREIHLRAIEALATWNSQ